MEVLQRTANRGSVSTGDYEIDNSIKFETANTESLTKSQTASNRKTWTLSFWFKRTKVDTDLQYTFQANVSSSTVFDIVLNGITDWRISDYTSGSRSLAFYSTVPLRDASAWYHLVVACDTTQSTEANRFKIYLNGVQVDTISGYFSTAQYPAEDYETNINNSAATLSIGKSISASTNFCGYIAEVNFIDGLMKDEEDFGKFDSNSGIWQPIEYTGSYGNEGYYLDFADSGDLGDDESGNGKDFTENNITAADQATDTPTNNFCTWSPLWAESRANGTITEGATQVAWGGGAWKIARSSMAVSKGRWYWEIKGANVTGDTWNNNLFGFASVEGQNGQYGPTVLIGYSTGNYYYRVDNSQTGDSSTGWDSGGAWSSSDTFGFALDLESSTKKFILYRNGSAVNGSGTDLVSAFQTEQFFTPYATSYNGDTQFLNWGGYTVNTISSAASDANGYGTFEYAPPTGYYALCTKNLAEYG